MKDKEETYISMGSSKARRKGMWEPVSWEGELYLIVLVPSLYQPPCGSSCEGSPTLGRVERVSVYTTKAIPTPILMGKTVFE